MTDAEFIQEARAKVRKMTPLTREKILADLEVWLIKRRIICKPQPKGKK